MENLLEAVTHVMLNLPSYEGKFHTRKRFQKDVLKAFIHFYGAQNVFV